MTKANARPRISGRTLIIWCGYAVLAGIFAGSWVAGFAKGWRDAATARAHSAAISEQALPSGAKREAH